SPVTTYPITCTQGTLTAVNYSFASFVPGVLTVTPAATTTALTSNHNPANPGQSVNLTATVSSTAGTPTGTVTLLEGSVVLGTITLNGGTGAFSTSSLSSGTHSITAAYGGSTNFSGSTSSGLSQVVKTSTTTSVGSNLQPSVFGQAITFTAT